MFNMGDIPKIPRVYTDFFLQKEGFIDIDAKILY